MSGRDLFEEQFRAFLTGNLTRRNMMIKSAAAAAGVTAVAAGGPILRSSSNVMAQDATPVAGGVLRMGMQSDPSALDPFSVVLHPEDPRHHPPRPDPAGSVAVFMVTARALPQIGAFGDLGCGQQYGVHSYHGHRL